MRRLLYPIVFLALLFSGCSRAVKSGRGGLVIFYISNLPRDDAGWAELKSAIDEYEDPLVIVDDTDCFDYESMAFWDGQKEIYMLESLGCDLCFPPATWQLVGSRRLHDISNRAEFFLVGLDLADDSGQHVLSRYMIRQHSPYRLAFSAPARPFEEYELEGYSYLPLDSMLKVTSTFLALQSDFFFFFGSLEDSVTAGVDILKRGGENKILNARFLSRFEYKLKEQGFNPGQGDTSPLALWEAYEDTLDDVVLAEIDGPIDADSLNRLCEVAVAKLSYSIALPAGTVVFLPDSFITADIPAGEITFGIMRRITRPEIFVYVPSSNLEEDSGSDEIDVYSAEGVTGAIVAFSTLSGSVRAVRPTGITSARIIREMFRMEEEP
ncbi:hypothetical protein JXM67_13080 [candidate division WOR-3 bacterium]|nr:hypothetical protein [candidate division WOR-3 bacterium]